MTEIDRIYLMQYWMFSTSILKTDFCIMYVSDIRGYGQNAFRSYHMRFIRVQYNPYTIQELK
jgi:hypothetical protein